MGGLIDKVNTPDFATSIGLLKYGFLDIESNGPPLIRTKGFINKIKKFLGFLEV